MNGDGVPDVIVGAPEESGQIGLSAHHGQIHALSGVDGSVLWTKRHIGTASVRFGASLNVMGVRRLATCSAAMSHPPEM